MNTPLDFEMDEENLLAFEFPVQSRYGSMQEFIDSFTESASQKKHLVQDQK